MKTLFILPPQWYPMNPYLSAAQLIGQFKKNGMHAAARDLNIEFFSAAIWNIPQALQIHSDFPLIRRAAKMRYMPPGNYAAIFL